ncbi:MAG: hypothetical protein ABGZ53_10340 [Fuerstiella sp.]
MRKWLAFHADQEFSHALILPDEARASTIGVVLVAQCGLSLTTPVPAEARQPCSRQRIPNENLQSIEKMTANSETQH